MLRLTQAQAEVLTPLVHKAASGRQNVLFLATCALAWDPEVGAVTWRLQATCVPQAKAQKALQGALSEKPKAAPSRRKRLK